MIEEKQAPAEVGITFPQDAFRALDGAVAGRSAYCPARCVYCLKTRFTVV